MVLTDELIKQIGRLLKNGMYAQHVVAALGIADSTYYYWIQTAKKLQAKKDKYDIVMQKKISKEDLAPEDYEILSNEPEFTDYQLLLLDLLDTTKKASAKAIKSSLKEIKTASKKHWQAAAWYLERRYPDKFGRREKHEHNVEVTKIKDFSNLTEEEAREMYLEKLKKMDMD